MERFDDPLTKLSVDEQRTLDTIAIELGTVESELPAGGLPPVRVRRIGAAIIAAVAGLLALGIVGVLTGTVPTLLLAVGLAALVGVLAGRASCTPTAPSH